MRKIHNQAKGHRPEQGHWILARLGKRVLRPGGLALTRELLSRLPASGSDVVELAPGLGRTAALLLAARPASYVGVDTDAEAAGRLREVVAGRGRVVVADAAATGLPDASADLVVGEAMLTMQGAKTKQAIVAEAARVLRPGGCYGIHELGLTPESVSEEVKQEIQQALARAIRVNARPLTLAEWTDLLTGAGLQVQETAEAPMALLEPRRLIADEGVVGALRFLVNLLRQPAARARVLQMRRTFRQHSGVLTAFALVAYKPQTAASS